MTAEEAKKLARKTLSPQRFRHTKNVAAAARTLALRFGANPDAAELAGWLHDIVKEWSRSELLQLAGQDDIIAKSIMARPVPVWHGPCGALYAQQKLGVHNPQVLSAIACHTTGRAGMTLMDKVLYLADMISAERDFEGVDAIRALAENDLDAAVEASMEENIAYLHRKGKKLDVDTLQALEDLKQRGARTRTEEKV